MNWLVRIGLTMFSEDQRSACTWQNWFTWNYMLFSGRRVFENEKNRAWVVSKSVVDAVGEFEAIPCPVYRTIVHIRA